MSSSSVAEPTMRDIPIGRSALWILIAGELAVFSGFILGFLLLRYRFPVEWAEQAHHTNSYVGLVNTFILLTSDLLIMFAHKESLNKNIDKVKWFIRGTIALGAVFLVIKAFEYTDHMGQGITITSWGLVEAGKMSAIAAKYWTFYYAMTGLHGLHIVVGMLAMFIVCQTMTATKNLHRTELIGMYWHMVDIVWMVVFPLFYLLK